MKYIEFYQHFKDYPLIRVADIENIEGDFDHRRLYEWQKKGYLKKLVKGFYVLKDKELSEKEMNFIANQLYQPSYLSLEYALRLYGLIPEEVFLYTSVTTKATRRIEAVVGNFLYQSVKKELFFGYRLEQEKDFSFKIAEPEKAVLDFLYLRKDLQSKEAIFELRINKDNFREIVDQDKLDQYLQRFSSRSLEKKVKFLKEYVES